MFTVKPWGVLDTGEAVDLITLTSEAGATVEISNFGGIIRSLTIPMPDGTSRQAVLQYDTLEEYLRGNFYIGATVGPYANRIRGGQFSIDGHSYQLEQNEGNNTLHSGKTGWQDMCFDYEADADQLTLKRHSPDGEGGFPGNVDVTIQFRWKTPMALEINYSATTDQPTILSMTNHSYFNLGTEDTILTHQLWLRADAYTPVDEELLPTGEILPVAGTTLDFTSLRPIAEAYDHNFAITPGEGSVATLVSPSGDLTMDVFTDKPGIQVYSGGAMGAPFVLHAGVCLETQHFPDAPNIDAFPSAVVTPEETYRSTTVFAFRTCDSG